MLILYNIIIMSKYFGLIGGVLYAIIYTITRDSFVEVRHFIINTIPGFNTNFIEAFFTLVYAIGQVPCGMFIDRYGIKKTGLILSFFMCIGFFICAKSISVNIFILGRTLTAIGSIGGFLMALKIGQVMMNEKLFTTFISITFAISTILAIITMNFIMPYCKWQSIFLAKFTTSILIFVCFLLYEEKNSTNKLEKKFIHEKEKKSIIPILLTKDIILIFIFIFTSCIAYYTISETTYIGTYLQQKGLIKKTATIYSFIFAGDLLSSLISGLLEKFITKEKIGFFTNIICLICIFTLMFSQNLTLLLLSAFGIGFSNCIQYFILSILKDYSPVEHFGILMGITNLICMLTAPIGQLTLSKLIKNSSHLTYIFYFVSIFTILALVNSLLFISKKSKNLCSSV